ncbi:MAG: DALR anticodon-binding domain-containing protein, partial [Varibaculum cambriense]|nr:DALR anticodon-binding domain-containing protein [Varibaculum cambriense]
VLAQYPAELKLAAEEREPHRIPRYLEKLAAGYHTWYNHCRVIPRSGEEITAAHVARRHLNEAVRQVLENGLDLCGVVAPERM